MNLTSRSGRWLGYKQAPVFALFHFGRCSDVKTTWVFIRMGRTVRRFCLALTFRFKTGCTHCLTGTRSTLPRTSPTSTRADRPFMSWPILASALVIPPQFRIFRKKPSRMQPVESARWLQGLAYALCFLIGSSIAFSSGRDHRAQPCPAAVGRWQVPQLSLAQTELRAVHREPAKIPVAFRVHACLVVNVVVSARGTVKCAHARSGHPLLQVAAEEAAERWLFRPLRRARSGGAFVGSVLLPISTSTSDPCEGARQSMQARN